MKYLALLSILLFLFSCNSDNDPNKRERLYWEHDLSPEIFDKAEKENKLVLLNLGANWCHWCHVMEDSTYADQKVIKYLNEHFVYVHADQDANPDLSARYRRYGWPATIILNSKGEDLLKKAGYIDPETFLKLLKAIVKNPTPGSDSESLASIPSGSGTNDALIEKLKENFRKSLDLKVGGLKSAQKSVDWDTYEYALFYDKSEESRLWLKKSVEGAKKLCDPEWGGVYQYSTHSDWNHLHFEKLLTKQARYLRIFLLDYEYNGDEESLQKAREIIGYCDRFLKQDNELYGNSQDADLVQGEHSGSYFKLKDKERVKLGIPRVDDNTYTSNNASFAIALLHMYAVTGEQSYLDKHNAIYKTLKFRKNKNGLYKHAEVPGSVESLRDNIAMAELLAERLKFFGPEAETIRKMDQLLSAIHDMFALPNGSYKSFSGDNGLIPEPVILENIELARIVNWFGAYSEMPFYRSLASKTLSFLTQPAVAKGYYTEPAIISLSIELNSEMNNHIACGENSGLFVQKAYAMAPFFSDFRAYSKETLPSDKMFMFESFKKTTMFICTPSYCSSPMFTKLDIGSFFKS